MATTNFASREVYNTYNKGTIVSTSSSDFRYIGYSNNAGDNKYSTCYKFVFPTIDGTINSITLTPELYNPNAGNLLAGRAWKIGISIGSTNSNYASGDYSVQGTYTKSFALESNFLSGETRTMSPVTFTNVDSYKFLSGQTIYLYVYAAQQNIISKAKITALVGSIDYTPNTYYAKASTNSNSNATSSVSPSSGIKGTSVNFSAASSSNTVSYIYSDLKLYVSTTAGGSTLVATKNGYAQGLGTQLTTSYSTTFNSNIWYYAKATANSANPGDVTCTVDNITSTSAKINIPNGITTTFLDSYYYISSLSGEYYSSDFSYKTRGTRSNKYVNISGLTAETNQTWYVFAYNSYNEYYYKIGSVNFTTDASSYSITASVSNIGANSATVTIDTGPTPITNLNDYWYLSISTDDVLSSLEEVSSGLRTSSINLNNLKSQTSISRNIYVYSNVSKKYYKAGSITFETTVAQYVASLIVTGVTESQADITLFGLTDSTNLDSKYYLSESNEGLITNSLTIHSSENRGTTIRVSNLIPGYKYEFYCYVYNTYDNSYYYVGSVEFIAYSTIVYCKDNNILKKYRLYIYDKELEEFKGIILK